MDVEKSYNYIYMHQKKIDHKISVLHVDPFSILDVEKCQKLHPDT
jgi:hypothetical protein